MTLPKEDFWWFGALGKFPKDFLLKHLQIKEVSCPFATKGRRGLVGFKLLNLYQEKLPKSCCRSQQLPGSCYWQHLKCWGKKPKQTKQNKANNPNTWTKLFSEVSAVLWNTRDLAVCASRSDLTSLTSTGRVSQSSSPAPLLLSTQSSADTGTAQREPRAVQRPMQSPPALHASLACCHNAEARCSQPFSTLNNLLQFQEPDRSGSQASAFQSHLWEENTEATALIYSYFESILKVSL